MIRLFVGLELPKAVRQHLHLMAGGIPSARWTEIANYHVTLAFIGGVEEPQAADIDDALRGITQPAFDMTLTGVGQFDRGGHTHIVWAGISPNSNLIHLHDKIRAALLRLDLSIDLRKFTPHVTLARLKPEAAQDRVIRFLTEHALFASSNFFIDHFTLFRSTKGMGGPVYEPLQNYPLFE